MCDGCVLGCDYWDIGCGFFVKVEVFLELGFGFVVFGLFKVCSIEELVLLWLFGFCFF